MHALLSKARLYLGYISAHKWLRRGLIGGVTLSIMMSCQIRPDAGPSFDESLDLKGNQQNVVLLHGMWRTSFAMNSIEAFLTEQGYNVVSISYPSTDHEVQTLVEEYLVPEIEKLQQNSDGRIHFVTHSMGGILVRYYLKHHEMTALGKVVMIAPPNHGSELTGVFDDTEWFTKFAGPAGEQLKADDDSWVNGLGKVDFELGVVAGNYNTNWITSWLLPGEDDGAVSLESTKIEGMADFITVPEKHYKIRSAKVVMQQAAYFLKYGHFYLSENSN